MVIVMVLLYLVALATNTDYAYGASSSVTNVTLVPGPNKVLVVWTPPTTTPSSLRGYRVIAATGAGTTTCSVSVSSRSRCLLDNLMVGSTYSIQVHMIAPGLVDPGSSPLHFKAGLYPGSPTGSKRVEGTQLRAVDLSGFNLTGLNLSGADVRSTKMTGAVLRNADLAGTQLEGSDLSGVTSSGNSGIPASLPSGVKMANGYLVGPGANLWGANLAAADLSGVNLWKANLANAILANSTLRGSNLAAANLTNTDLSGADLRFSNMKGAVLTGANVSDADMRRAIVGDSLRSGGLRGFPTLPQGYVLRNGYLIGPGVSLWRANLAGVDLSGVSLAYVNAQEADFSEAILTNNNVDGANLAATFTDAVTIGWLGTPSRLPTGHLFANGKLWGQWSTPEEPTRLSSEASHRSLIISWSAPASYSVYGTVQYTLEYGAVGGDLNTITTSSTTVVLEELVNGETYRLRVRAVSGLKHGVWSAAIFGTPVAAPGAPSSLVVDPARSSASLTWQPPTTGALPTSYAVEYWSTARPQHKMTLSTDSTRVTLTGLSPGDQYVFSVRALSGDVPGPWLTSPAATLSYRWRGLSVQPQGLPAWSYLHNETSYTSDGGWVLLLEITSKVALDNHGVIKRGCYAVKINSLRVVEWLVPAPGCETDDPWGPRADLIPTTKGVLFMSVYYDYDEFCRYGNIPLLRLLSNTGEWKDLINRSDYCQHGGGPDYTTVDLHAATNSQGGVLYATDSVLNQWDCWYYASCINPGEFTEYGLSAGYIDVGIDSATDGLWSRRLVYSEPLELYGVYAHGSGLGILVGVLATTALDGTTLQPGLHLVTVSPNTTGTDTSVTTLASPNGPGSQVRYRTQARLATGGTDLYVHERYISQEGALRSRVSKYTRDGEILWSVGGDVSEGGSASAFIATTGGIVVDSNSWVNGPLPTAEESCSTAGSSPSSSNERIYLVTTDGSVVEALTACTFSTLRLDNRADYSIDATPDGGLLWGASLLLR